MNSFAGDYTERGAIDFMRGAISKSPVIFSGQPFGPAQLAKIQKRINRPVHLRRHGNAAALVINDPSPREIEVLKEFTPHVLIRGASAGLTHFCHGSVARTMANYGFKIFIPHSSPPEAFGQLPQYSLIGTMEFLRSSEERLSSYPSIGTGFSASGGGAYAGEVRAVFVLNLIQDFEALSPLLERALVSNGSFDVRVAVSELVARSKLWAVIKAFFDAVNIRWFIAPQPFDVVEALGFRRSLLITASESSAPGHTLCYRACQMAPSRTIKITLQHGYENIGLRHHIAHDVTFPHGVRFASDIILTWETAERLPNLAAADYSKVVPVGLTKRFSEDAAISAERIFSSGSEAAPHKMGHTAKVLLGENLQSVRFKVPTRRDRFLTFIRNSAKLSQCNLVIRSHPAKPKFEDHQTPPNVAFSVGTISAAEMRAYDAVISPPSTLVLDSVISGVPTAVWSDAATAGDIQNYAGLYSVTDAGDIPSFMARSRTGGSCSAMDWALRNTCSFNGIPKAWSVLTSLVR